MFDKFLSDHKDDKDGMTNEEGEKFRKAFEDPKVGAKKERLQKTLHFPSLPACLPAFTCFLTTLFFFSFSRSSSAPASIGSTSFERCSRTTWTKYPTPSTELRPNSIFHSWKG